MQDGNVTARLKEIREELAKASQIDLKDLLEELEQARQAALGVRITAKLSGCRSYNGKG